jgi:hypothetical protein
MIFPSIFSATTRIKEFQQGAEDYGSSQSHDDAYSHPETDRSQNVYKTPMNNHKPIPSYESVYIIH